MDEFEETFEEFDKLFEVSFDLFERLEVMNVFEESFKVPSFVNFERSSSTETTSFVAAATAASETGGVATIVVIIAVGASSRSVRADLNSILICNVCSRVTYVVRVTHVVINNMHYSS